MKTVDLLFEETGLTVEDIAERAALPVDRVGAIAVGRWTPSPDERRKVCSVFGVEPQDVTWGHATPIQHIWGHGPG